MRSAFLPRVRVRYSAKEESIVKRMSGAEILVESLRKEGVDTIFGYPGGVMLGIFDKLYEQGNLLCVRTHPGQVSACLRQSQLSERQWYMPLPVIGDCLSGFG